MDEPKKYVTEKQPNINNASASAAESGAQEHFARAMELVCESMEEQKRAYENENSALREKLRRYEDTFLRLKDLNEKKDEYIRRLQDDAQRYVEAREAAEKQQRDYAAKYQELLNACDALRNVKQDAQEIARTELRAEEEQARAEMLAGIEREREAAAYEIERLKKETEELRRKKQEAAEALRSRLAESPNCKLAEKSAAESEPNHAPAGEPEITDKAEPEAADNTAAEITDKPQAKKIKKAKRKKPQSKAARAWKIVGETVFYAVLALMVAAAVLVRASSDGSPRTIAGFSAMIVLTESMQSEIPKGSLVIAKAVDTDTLEIGDDITYMANQTTSITHRIVGIIENYENTGERAFVTQGIMNSAVDTQPVISSNVVGKVVFHSELLGIVLSFIGSYWPVILVAAVVLVLLVRTLRRIAGEPHEKADQPSAAPGA